MLKYFLITVDPLLLILNQRQFKVQNATLLKSLNIFFKFLKHHFLSKLPNKVDQLSNCYLTSSRFQTDQIITVYLAFLSVAYKILTNILHIEANICSTNTTRIIYAEQINHRSCFVVSQVLEKFQQYSKPSCCLFVDLFTCSIWYFS